MTYQPPLVSTLLKGCLTAALALVLTARSEAVLPKAPVITKVDFSFAGLNNGTPVVGNLHSYLVKWTDMSLDEEGFDVQVKAGSDPFVTFSRTSANTTQAALIGVTGLAAGTDVQFQVVAWKFNGAKVESAASKVFTFKVPGDSAEAALDPPSGLAATNVDDSRVKLSWVDNSNSELFYQIDLKEASGQAFQALTFVNHSSSNPTEHSFRLRLVPNTDYNFRVRATRLQSTTATQPNASFYSNTVTLRTPVLTPPTNLGAQTLSERLIRLRWQDNSTNETGYEVQYREAGGTGNYSVLGTLAESSSFVDVPVPQGSSLEWRVVALYTYTPSGATSTTTIRSDPSNVVTYSTTFPEPANLQAAMTGRASSIDLTWEDRSSTEHGFNIYSRPEGGSTWYFARAVRDNVTRVSVDSRTESNDGTGKPVFITLEPGLTHEFVVRAVSSDETNVSLDSNIASAQARHGFTCRPYHPVQQGFAITRVEGTEIMTGYLVTTSHAANRTDWSVTGLPAGVSFESGTGLITGTPTAAGVFNCTMTASFTDSPTVSSPLVLRVLRTVTGPQVAKTIPNTTIGIKTPFRVQLADKFSDADAETAVRLETSLLDTFGKPRVIDIHLFPSLAPIAVANFMAYINAGDYTNLAFHRSVSGFVVQGGSLRAVAAPRSFASIPSRPPATNEPGITNVRGMLSAAKVGPRNATATLTSGTVAKDETFGYVGNPDSATTDFFFNLANNSANLDEQNGGFTAFGRVSTSGMAVVDIIAALPTGSYQNGNTTDTYDASLDKRILLDGSLTAFSGIPMNAGTAPADMDLNKTVRITSASVTPTMRYSISNPSPTVVEAVIEGNELKLNGLTEGSANVTVIAADLDNASSSRTFNVIVQKGFKQPAITRHPVSQAVVAGTKVTFSVTATGTSLTYQWRRKIGNGEFANIDGATGPSHIITSAQAGDAAFYEVQVSNPTTTLTSNPARLDLRAAPSVGAIQETKLVEVGSPLQLTVSNVTGAPAPTFAWKRGTAAVAAQTTSVLKIAAAKLTDAGIYTATASNIVSKATTAGVTVYVVDKKVTRQIFTSGRTITLTAPVAGPGLLYRWRKDNVDIPLAQPRFSGMQDPALKITGTDSADTGKYTCLVTLPDGLGNVETGVIELFIVQRPSLPALTGINAPPTAFIGVDYSWKLPYSPLASLTPASFTCGGLPAGLKLNTTTGVISGRPTAVGVFKITATAVNAAGSSLPAAVGELTVSPLPFSNIGTFAGMITPSLVLNQNKGGRFDLTVQDTGSYTAKVILGTETIAAAGVLGVGTSITGATTITYQSRVQVKRKDKSTLTLLFELDPDLGYITGVVTNGAETSTISGFRQFWDEKWRPCNYSNINTTMAYNMALNLNADEDEGDVGKANVPQGSGYLGMIVSPKGTGAISGRLADGTTITSSSMIGPQGEALVFLMLYKNTGSIFGQMDLGDDLLGPSTSYVRRVDGLVRWIKDVQPGTERNYQAGIPETNLIVLGATYAKPGTNIIVMGLPNLAGTSTNAMIDFTQGGLATATRNPDRAVRLTTLNTTAYPVPNEAFTTLNIVSGTGSFTGTFSLLDNAVPRSVTYQGLVIPPIPHTPAVTNSSGIITANEIPGVGAFATGYFLLPELLPSTTKSKINSGRVLIQGTPITITTQPADQTANPGANISLGVSIAAGAQGTVTYRWRKNGNTITGATTSSLNLSSVTESNQGDYDCVISNGSFTVISEAATVSVNDPVTEVTIARTPTAAAVATGTQIVFTATAKGATPLLYQWKKDNADIPGATSAAYTISAGASTDNGSYTVTVSNSVTTGGVTSAANVLTVADPVVIASVGRTPADATVATGTAVTFSVTTTGTGPFTYQWKKGDTAITGATGETHTITSPVPADTGSYSVVVKNVVSTTGVTSGAVPLTVADP